jgi:type IV pilus assembly protein PilO
MAFDLNEKPWYVAALIGVVIGAVMLFVAKMYVYDDLKRKQARLINEIDDLNREIDKGLAAKRNLPRLEEDIKNYQLELDRLRRILPTKRETDQLIKKTKQLMERGHFQLQQFDPLDPQDQEFYQEWPINVVVLGTYHELGLFFDRLSRFSRIINVNNLAISPLGGRAKGSAASLSIQASFTERTFIYKE